MIFVTFVATFVTFVARFGLYLIFQGERRQGAILMAASRSGACLRQGTTGPLTPT